LRIINKNPDVEENQTKETGASVIKSGWGGSLARHQHNLSSVLLCHVPLCFARIFFYTICYFVFNVNFSRTLDLDLKSLIFFKCPVFGVMCLHILSSRHVRFEGALNTNCARTKHNVKI